MSIFYGIFKYLLYVSHSYLFHTVVYGTRHLSMNQVKFVEDSL